MQLNDAPKLMYGCNPLTMSPFNKQAETVEMLAKLLNDYQATTQYKMLQPAIAADIPPMVRTYSTADDIWQIAEGEDFSPDMAQMVFGNIKEEALSNKYQMLSFVGMWPETFSLACPELRQDIDFVCSAIQRHAKVYDLLTPEQRKQPNIAKEYLASVLRNGDNMKYTTIYDSFKDPEHMASIDYRIIAPFFTLHPDFPLEQMPLDAYQIAMEQLIKYPSLNDSIFRDLDIPPAALFKAKIMLDFPELHHKMQRRDCDAYTKVLPFLQSEQNEKLTQIEACQQALLDAQATGDEEAIEKAEWDLDEVQTLAGDENLRNEFYQTRHMQEFITGEKIFNPLVMTNEDVEVIATALQAKGMFSPDVSDVHLSVEEYQEKFQKVVENIMPHLHPPAKDLQVVEVSPELQELACMKYMQRNNPEMLNVLKQMEIEAFHQAYPKVEEQACSAKGIVIHRHLQEFAQDNDIIIPMTQWIERSHAAYMHDIQNEIAESRGNVHQTAMATFDVCHMMDVLGLENVIDDVDLKGFWQDVGRQVALLEMQKAKNPYDVEQDSLIYTLRGDMDWEKYGDFITKHINEGRAEVLQQHPAEWCNVLGIEMEHSIMCDTYPQAVFEGAVSLMEHIPMTTIQGHEDIIDMAAFFADCGREVVDARRRLEYNTYPNDEKTPYIDKRFIKAIETAVQNPQFGEFVKTHVNHGISQKNEWERSLIDREP